MVKHDCIIVGAGKMGLLHGALVQKSGRGRVREIIDTSVKSRFIAKGMALKHP